MCRRSRSEEENEDFRHPPDLFLGSADPDGTEEAPFFIPFAPDSDLELSMAEREQGAWNSWKCAAMAVAEERG